MYEFATVILLGLGVAAVVATIRQLGDTTRGLRMFLDLLLGLAIAWLADLTVFAGWGIQLREAWVDTVLTGLAIGGAAMLWTDLMALITSYARRSYDQATEIESRIPRRVA